MEVEEEVPKVARTYTLPRGPLNLENHCCYEEEVE